MSEQLSALETTVTKRFGKFVAEHAEEALLWLPMEEPGRTATEGVENSPPVVVRWVEFETDHKLWMPDADASDVPFFDMNVIIDLPEAVLKARDLSDDTGIYVELVPGAGLDINDPADQLPLIDSEYDPGNPCREFKALGKVLDMLERHEAAGKLTAAHRRRFPLDPVY